MAVLSANSCKAVEEGLYDTYILNGDTMFVFPCLKSEEPEMNFFAMQQMLGVKVMDPKEVVKIDSAPVEALDFPKPLVIYHGKCADGFSAAWVFHEVSKRIEVEFDFHPGIYQETPPDVSERDVYLVDFSYKRQVVKDMIQLGGARSITIIDHHLSAMKDLAGLDEEIADDANIAQHEIDGTDLEDYENPLALIFNMDMSGATMAWDYWKESFEAAGISRPLLLGHIEDRDLWKFKLPLTREVSAAVFSYEYTFENWDLLMSMDAVALLQLGVAGEAIERKHHKDIAELVSVCQRMIQIGAYLVPVASIPYTLTSDAGHLMASNYEDGKVFAACYWDTADARIFSLRSTENGLDVSIIASAYGGGGHKNAAGFKVPRDHELAQA